MPPRNDHIPEDVLSEMTIDTISIPPKDSYQGRVSPDQVKGLDEREIRFAAHLDRYEQRLDDVVDALVELGKGVRHMESRIIPLSRQQREVKPYIATLRNIGLALVGGLVAVILDKLSK
jgi:hypothetical protein